MSIEDHNKLAQALGVHVRPKFGLPLPAASYPVMTGLWYSQKIIKLDGWHFESCRFDNCQLIIETPHFILENCYIDASNSVEIAGKMINAVKFMNIVQMGGSKVTCQPSRNSDGTVSIGV